MQPPYRSFALLELPFTFTPTVQHSPLKENELEEEHQEQLSKHQNRESTLRSHIANVYDPVQLKECFQDKNFSESHSFIHHHHRHNNNNSNKDKSNKDKYNPVDGKENANFEVSGKENSTEKNYEYNNDNSSYDELMLSSEVAKQKNEHTDDSKELYLTIGDSNEYWSENMYSGWCQAQDWSKSNNNIIVTRSTTKEEGEEENYNAQKHKNENVFHCTSPQMLVHGFYRNDLLIRVHEVKRIHRVRDSVTGEVIREWEEEEVDSVDTNTNQKMKSEAPVSKTNETVADAREPRVEVIGVVSRELQLARPADFVFSLGHHDTTTITTTASSSKENNDDANYTLESNEGNSLRFESDIFPPARFLNEKTPYEVRYEMGRSVNYTVAEHVARLQDMAVTTTTTAARNTNNNNFSTSKHNEEKSNTENNEEEVPVLASPSEVDSSHDREFADFRQRVESGFVDTLMVSAHNTNLPPFELLPVQVDFLTQHECQINKSYTEQKLVNINRDKSGTSRKKIQRFIISVTGSLPELIVLNKLLQQRPLWIAGMLSEAMLYSGVCPRANFNKQLVNCVTYVIATGAFNRLRVRMNMNPFVNIRSVIYQRLMIRLLRRSEQGTLLRDASRSPYLASALAIILQRHKAQIDSYHSSILNKEEQKLSVEETEKHNSDTNSIFRHYPLTLTEVMCNVIKRGSLYITLQLIDILDDVLIATMVWNHIAPTLEREARHKAKKSEITINNSVSISSNPDLQEVKTEKEQEFYTNLYTQRDVAKENVHLLWSELQLNTEEKRNNTLEQEKLDFVEEEETVNMELPVNERDNPYGWLGQNQYTRITVRFTEALHSFLLDEVMPLLRFFAGSTGAKSVHEEKERVEPIQKQQQHNINDKQYRSTESMQDTINLEGNGSVSSGSNSRDIDDSDDDDSNSRSNSSMNASAPSSRERSDNDSTDQDESVRSSSNDSRIDESDDNDNEQEEEKDGTE